MKKYLLIRLKPRLAKRALVVVIIFLCGCAMCAFAAPVGMTKQTADILYAHRLVFQNATSSLHHEITGSVAGVTSFNGRTGTVTPALLDYSSFFPTKPVFQNATSTLHHEMVNSVAGVASFNGRTGAVLPMANDYTPAQVGAESQGAFSAYSSNIAHNGTPVKGYTNISGLAVNALPHNAFNSYSGNQAVNISGLQADDTTYAKAALLRSGGTMTGPIKGGVQATFGNTSTANICATGMVMASGMGKFTNISTSGYYYGNGSKLTGVTAAASLAYVSSHLTSNIAMTTANTYYNGPAVSLGAGTWLVVGSVLCYNGSGGYIYTGKLWDGTNVYSSTEAQDAGSSVEYLRLNLSAIITVASSATIYIAAASKGGSSYMYAACPDNGAGNTASYINAIKIQ